MWTGWAHLKELVMNIILTHDALEWKSDFVLRAPNLLRLEMGHVVEDYDEALTFFERLCSAEAFYLSFKSFISENSLLTEDFIIKFVSRFGYSLRALSLKHIRIIFQGKWEPVIRQWRMDLPFLERISVVDLVEYNYGFVNLVTFPSLSDNRVVPGTDGIKFTERIGQRVLVMQDRTCILRLKC